MTMPMGRCSYNAGQIRSIYLVDALGNSTMVLGNYVYPLFANFSSTNPYNSTLFSMLRIPMQLVLKKKGKRKDNSSGLLFHRNCNLLCEKYLNRTYTSPVILGKNRKSYHQPSYHLQEK